MEKRNHKNNSHTKASTWLRANAWTLLFMAVMLALWLSKDAKALAIRGLMQTGIMGRPVIEAGLRATSSRNDQNSTPAGVDSGSAHAPIEVVFQNQQGRTFSLQDLRGKVVFINFWATWCPPCRAEMPGIRDLKLQFAKDSSVVFLLVDVDGQLQKSAQYLRRKNLGQLMSTLPEDSLGFSSQNLGNGSLVKMLSPVPAELASSSVPASFVIDRRGNVVMRYIGAADYSHPGFLLAFKEFVDQH